MKWDEGRSWDERTDRKSQQSQSRYALRTMGTFDSQDNEPPIKRSSSDEDSTEKGTNPADLIDNLISATLKGSINDSAHLAWSAQSQEAKKLFRTNSAVRSFDLRQDNLNRIVAHIFTQDDYSVNIDVPSTATTGSSVGSRCWVNLRIWARSMIHHRWFIGFFMFLTIYAIFGPSIVSLVFTKHEDDLFMTINTMVFFAFLLELILLCMGKRNYFLKVTFVLDIVSVFSMLSDTWFLKGLLSGDGARVTRMARSSRMTRLARLVRVARVTRLLPRLMRMCGSARLDLASRLLKRRLWRCFLFLDSDRDGLVSYRDLKCFYLSILSQGSHMYWAKGEDLLKADMAVLCKGDDPKDARSYLEFHDFSQTFMRTQLGKSLVRYHVKDLDKEEGVWTMTQKLSDSAALKVCIGLLLLIGLLSVLETDVQDNGMQQGLMQLDEVVAGCMASASCIMSHICDLITFYGQAPGGDRPYEVKFVYLRGKTYFDNGVCLLEPVASLDPFQRIDDIMTSSSLRNSEAIQSCWPDYEDCQRSPQMSMTLLDWRQESIQTARGELIETSIIIGLLLIFVMVLNMAIANFSKKLLQPLRALVDDMQTMSSLELVNIDKEMETEHAVSTRTGVHAIIAKRSKPPKVVEELKHLQVACRSMRGAIRSWSKYVPPTVVQRLYSAGLEAQIGVWRQLATILFCDIKEFEDACKGLGPNDVLRVLEQVLSKIAEVIDEYRGTLLEFIGDEVLAVYNTPVKMDSHTLAGVSSAVQIHSTINAMAPYKSSEGREIKIRCRVGVHTSSILAGNIGSALRMKYGLLGDGINLTARLKGINNRYKTGTLASDKVIADAECSNRFIWRPVDLVAVKGKKEPTTIYEVLTVRTEETSSKLLIPTEKHKQAFQCYVERKFEESKSMFDEVHSAFEAEGHADEPSKMLSARCSRYIKDPPPADWDGVERLTKKS